MNHLLHPLAFDRRNVTAILRGRLAPREARERAQLVPEDVPRLRCPLRLRFLEQAAGQDWPCYVFGEFSRQPAPMLAAVPPSSKAIGYGLNWGDLATLSKVVELARKLWGWHWVRRFRGRMSSLANHLSVVEEPGWLGQWESPAAIQQECCPFPGCDRTVDWHFEAGGTVINLEVKYRPGDWQRWADARLQASMIATYFDTVSEKFPRKLSGQVNLVAMTLLGALGPELRARTAAFLDAHPTLDGVLFWSIARRDSPGCEYRLRPEAEIVCSLLRPAEEEDRWRNPFLVPTSFDWRSLAARKPTERAAIEGLFRLRP